jgi:hypothetical protein
MRTRPGEEANMRTGPGEEKNMRTKPGEEEYMRSGQGEEITINVPLFKKLRDIIFFCGTITL